MVYEKLTHLPARIDFQGTLLIRGIYFGEFLDTWNPKAHQFKMDGNGELNNHFQLVKKFGSSK